jgi:hypothetical protein
MEIEVKLKSLSEIAQYGMFLLGDYLDDEQWDDVNQRTDVEKIKHFYCHSDCQDFAEVLNCITDWPIVIISHKTRGPIHYMVKMPDGNLLDAKGIFTESQIPPRYGLKKLIFTEIQPGETQESVSNGPLDSFRGDEDDEDPWRYAISAIRQFSHEPYGTPEFQKFSWKGIVDIMGIHDVEVEDLQAPKI